MSSPIIISTYNIQHFQLQKWIVKQNRVCEVRLIPGLNLDPIKNTDQRCMFLEDQICVVL